MNILIIINSFRLGGAEKLCYDLARELSIKSNVKVFLYSIGKIENDLELELFKSFENSCVKVGTFNKPYRKKRLETAIKIKKFCEKNEINVVHTNGQSPDFLARISKLLGNKSKLVVTIHSTAGYSKTQESILGKYTDVYTVVSKDTLQYSKNQLGITQKVHLIDNGINLQVYSNIHKENIPFEILSVGRVQSEKDYVKAAHFLAPFLKKHREVKWLIYGDYTSDTNYYCTLIKEIKKIGIENHVEFKGVSTTPKDIYKHGNVFVLASVYEGFGNAFIEAIMSEHFIFSRNVGVIQDILKDGGIIHSLDDEKSIEFLEDIYAKRAFETELEINKHFETELEINKQIVSNRFSLESMVEKYFEIYTEVSE